MKTNFCNTSAGITHQVLNYAQCSIKPPAAPSRTHRRVQFPAPASATSTPSSVSETTVSGWDAFGADDDEAADLLNISSNKKRAANTVLLPPPVSPNLTAPPPKPLRPTSGGISLQGPPSSLQQPPLRNSFLEVQPSLLQPTLPVHLQPSANLQGPALLRPQGYGPGARIPNPMKVIPKFPKHTDVSLTPETTLPVSVKYDEKVAKSPPPPMHHFNALRKWNVKLLWAMQALRFDLPTQIQQYAIPCIRQGRDVMASAPTGTGKTGAYVLPVVANAMTQSREGLPKNVAYPGVLILAPTRELVSQLHELISRLIRGMHLKVVQLHGGDSMAHQMMAMRGGVDIVVATPGRLLDHVIDRKSVHLGRVCQVIIDEADKMLELGFEPQLTRIMTWGQLQPEHQTCVFSTSMPHPVRQLAQRYLKPDHVSIRVGSIFGANPLVTHRVIPCARPDKYSQLRALLESNTHTDNNNIATTDDDVPSSLSSQHLHQTAPVSSQQQAPASFSPNMVVGSNDDNDGTMMSPGGLAPASGLTIVFCNSYKEASQVHAHLVSELGISAGVLHSKLPQAAREEALQCFRYGVTPVLVSTLLAGRGIDVPDVSLVINWDVPLSQAEYVQRCGRTGRAGRRGEAVTLFTPRESPAAPWMVQVIKSINQPVPQWLLDLGKAERAKQQHQHNDGATLQTQANWAAADARSDAASTSSTTRSSQATGRFVGRSADAAKRAAVAKQWADLLPDSVAHRQTSSTFKSGSRQDMTQNGGEARHATESVSSALPGGEQVSDEELLKQWYDLLASSKGKSNRNNKNVSGWGSGSSTGDSNNPDPHETAAVQLPPGFSSDGPRVQDAVAWGDGMAAQHLQHGTRDDDDDLFDSDDNEDDEQVEMHGTSSHVEVPMSSNGHHQTNRKTRSQDTSSTQQDHDLDVEDLNQDDLGHAEDGSSARMSARSKRLFAAFH